MAATYGATQALRDLIIRVLEKYGEATSVDDLVKKLEAEFNEKFPRSTVWKHLSVLVEEGIVRIKNGRYTLSKGEVEDVQNDVLIEYVSEKLEVLKGLLAEGKYEEFTRRLKTLLKMADRLGIIKFVGRKIAEEIAELMAQIGDSEALTIFTVIYEPLRNMSLNVLDEAFGQFAKRLLMAYYRQLIEDLNADVKITGEWTSPNGIFKLTGLKGIGVMAFLDDVKANAYTGIHEVSPTKALEADLEFIPSIIESLENTLTNYDPYDPCKTVKLVLVHLSLHLVLKAVKPCINAVGPDMRKAFLKHALKAYESILEFLEEMRRYKPGVKVYYRVLDDGLREFSLEDLLEIEGLVRELMRKR